MKIDIILQGFNLLNFNLNNFAKALEDLKADGSIQKRHAFLLEAQLELLKQSVDQLKGLILTYNNETREQLTRTDNEFRIYAQELETKIFNLETEIKDLQKEPVKKKWWRK